MKPARGFAPILILCLIVALSVAGFVFYKTVIKPPEKLVDVQFTPPSEKQLQEATKSPDETVYPDSIGANWKTYKSDKSGWQVSYAEDYRMINGGTNCAISGGSSVDENTFCFFSPGFGPDNNFSDLGFQVRTDSYDEPVKSQEALADCTFLKEEDCKQVIIGNYIKTKKFLYTYVDQGIIEKQERIFLLDPSKEHIITIEFNYRPCEKKVTSNCLKQEDYDSKSSQILSTFRFI